MTLLKGFHESGHQADAKNRAVIDLHKLESVSGKLQFGTINSLCCKLILNNGNTFVTGIPGKNILQKSCLSAAQKPVTR
jgi:hypothetical protein